MKPAFQIAARSWGKLMHTTWYQCPRLKRIIYRADMDVRQNEIKEDEYRRNNQDEADEHAASRRIMGF